MEIELKSALESFSNYNDLFKALTLEFNKYNAFVDRYNELFKNKLNNINLYQINIEYCRGQCNLVLITDNHHYVFEHELRPDNIEEVIEKLFNKINTEHDSIKQTYKEMNTRLKDLDLFSK